MKHLLLLFLFTTSLVLGQKGPDKPDCVIAGPTVDGNLYTFSIPSNLAQCTDCHDWDISSISLPAPVIQHSPSDQKNVFTVEAVSSGTFTLNVTYFNETGCHTCQKSVTVVVTEPCFEPSIEGKVDCGPGGSSNNLVRLLNSSNISQVVWTFDPLDNPGYYQGFSFNNGTTLPDGRSFVVSTSASNNFEEFFSLDPGAVCAPFKEVCLNLDVTFTDNTCGGSWNGDICENFTIPAPFTAVTPNPADREITVSLFNLENRNVTLELYDMNGKKIESVKVEIGSNQFAKQLQLPKTTGNLLLLKVIEDGRVIDTKKIVKN